MESLEELLGDMENLPHKLRDMLTKLREMDLEVENTKDALSRRTEKFFVKMETMEKSAKEAEHQSIRSSYYRIFEIQKEKEILADEAFEMVVKYLRLIDQKIEQSTLKLEADNKGITKVLKLRVAEADQPSTSVKKKKRDSTSGRSKHNQGCSKIQKRRGSNTSTTSVEKGNSMEKALTPSSIPEGRSASGNSSPLVPQTSNIAPTASAAASPASGLANSVGPVSYNLGHIGAGGNAIAAAASQAIAATQHMQQGRRTASLKASYEAINTGGVHAAEFSRELAGAAQTAIAAIQESSKKNKKKLAVSNPPSTNAKPTSVQQQAQEAHQQQQQVQHQQAHQHQHHQQQQQQAQQQQSAVTAAAASSQVGASTTASAASAAAAATVAAQAAAAADADNPEWIFDPNEPRYCICDQVSYGDMVACDNANCPHEWFHYPCVNITASPKGKWYCPKCITSIKRRGGRKN